MKSIETASAKSIADYLQHLWDISWNRAHFNGKGLLSDDPDAERVWKHLFEFVFSDDISMKIRNRFPDFDYCDPDETYYSDVTAFIDGFKEYAKNHKDEGDEAFILPTFDEWVCNK